MITEKRITLKNVGEIDPGNIDDYINAGGYQALAKARESITADLISEIERSGRLRGRGGAGFNTGFKWRSAAGEHAEEKYVICNADEGEPGTYKDRILLENDPHSILEGMLICAHAIGATQAIIYCRGEYKLAQSLLSHAIAQAEERGLPGTVRLTLASGAGSYVCGEETALIESLEGKRGEPRLKPPYPTTQGLWGKPTVINNVETFATIPYIVEKGADTFKAIGSPSYPGTKIFALSGDVVNRVYAEVPTDVTLRDIVYDIGGGVPNGRPPRAVQVGGSSCAFLAGDALDITIDFESMAEKGAALGSGSVLVIDDSHNIVDVLVGVQDFFAHESCGKCVACREGGARVAQLVRKLAEGKGARSDIRLLKRLCGYMSVASFCPLGQTAVTALTGAMVLFPGDFDSKLAGKEALANG